LSNNFADGRVQTYFAGTIIIEQDITKMIQVNQINEYINITVTGITQDIVITVTDLTEVTNIQVADIGIKGDKGIQG
jgi:uncharacterized membrane protein YoaT (DUF817 family)